MRRDQALKAKVALSLRSFQPRSLPHDNKKSAAVVMALTDVGHGADLAGLPHHSSWNRQAALILTRRAANLRQHPGQWALPGGRVDAGETPEQAALRELKEEVGLTLDDASIMGRLDDFSTRSGYVITPIIVWAGAARRIAPNPDEVQSIHRIALTELRRPDAPILKEREGSEHPVLLMPVGKSWIAAPTAAFLYQFREVCLMGLHTRVVQFEQPDFAWR